MSTTWILVADSAKARLFSTSSEDDRMLVEIEDFLHPEGRGREPSQDRPPRTHDRLGPARHAIERRTSSEQKSVEHFARELAAVLERGRFDHRYDSLVLVAPAHFLGALHAALSDDVRERLIAELSKDLTAADPQTIRSHLPTRIELFRPAVAPGEERPARHP